MVRNICRRSLEVTEGIEAGQREKYHLESAVAASGCSF